MIGSLALNQMKYTGKAIFFLFSGAFLIFLYASLLDPFLNLWDERFHALVGKNLMKHPLMPTLYDDPVVPMAYDRWDHAYIWLHKQPLFLWIISLSFKVFGVSEYSLRIPSVIMASLIVPMSYRTGKLLINENSGYISAFLFTTSFYLMKLVSGRQELDHNDVAFLFFISASIWSWIEYVHSRSKKWLILIGLFSGFAVLTKWLAGLLIYLGWFTYLITGLFNEKLHDGKNHNPRYSGFGDFVFSILITAFIAIPWQLLIFSWYPAEASKSISYTSMHFFYVIEGHGGSLWYYFINISQLYGNVLVYCIPFGLIFLYYKIQKLPLRIGFLIIPIFVYFFFSLAKTKMASYPYIAALPVYIGIAGFIDYLFSGKFAFLSNKKWNGFLLTGFLIIIGLLNFKTEEANKAVNSMQIHNKAVFQNLSQTLPANMVVFNVRGRHYIECMFYTGLPSYNFIPSLFQYEEIRKRGRKAAIFKTSRDTIPNYLLNSPGTLIIHDELQSYE